MADDVFGIVGTTQAAHFKVEEAVAEGGFAVVYRAYHDAFRASVALKCLKVPATLTADERAQFLDKFREEAELLFRLSAVIPAVVRPLQFGTLDLPKRFVPFLALEWLEGETLEVMRDRRDAAGEPPIALRKLVRLLTPVARALAQAHRLPGPKGPLAVVHCDLKPDNLYRATSNGLDTMKILDFGIARVKSATPGLVAKSTGGKGMNAFTPQYAAPEQWQPEVWGATGPWTDVWGLAISMVDMIAGRAPIEGSLAAMMGIALDPKKRPTPRALGVTVPDAVEATFVRALEVDPNKRTRSVEEFWTALEKGLGVGSTFSVVDARAEIPESAPPPSGGAALPDLPPLGAPRVPRLDANAPTLDVRSLQNGASGEPVIPTLDIPVPQVPPPRAAPPARVAVVDPVDLAAEEQKLSFQLSMSPARSRRPVAPVHVPYHAVRREQTSLRPLLDKLAAPIKLAILAMLIMAADQAYFRLTGDQFTVGPARAFWVAGPLVGIAALLAFVRLMSND